MMLVVQWLLFVLETLTAFRSFLLNLQGLPNFLVYLAPEFRKVHRLYPNAKYFNFIRRLAVAATFTTENLTTQGEGAAVDDDDDDDDDDCDQTEGNESPPDGNKNDGNSHSRNQENETVETDLPPLPEPDAAAAPAMETV
jgi:hypothetical protein